MSEVLTKEQEVALSRLKNWNARNPTEYLTLRGECTVQWVKDWAFKVLETGRFSFAEVYHAGNTCSVTFK